MRRGEDESGTICQKRKLILIVTFFESARKGLTTNTIKK